MVPSKKDYTNLAALDQHGPLPTEKQQLWEELKQVVRLHDGQIQIARGMYPVGFSPIQKQEIHAFSDASIYGTGHVIYLRSFNGSHSVHVSFVTAQSRLAPRSSLSVPRLELCAAVDMSLAVQIVANDLDIQSANIFFYSDSKVVLGYLHNTIKRFSRYITRRINLILKSSKSSQWSYVETEVNPADIASRSQDCLSLQQSCWIQGPPFLWNNVAPQLLLDYQDIPLPEEDLQVSTLKSKTSTEDDFLLLCSRVSTLNKLLSVLHISYSFIFKCLDNSLLSRGYSLALRHNVPSDWCLRQAVLLCQKESYP